MRCSVIERLVHSVAEFILPARQAGEAALAFVPIAGRHVKQRQCQAVVVEPLADFRRGMLVGEQELDTFEAGFGRSGEAVEER